MILGCPRPKYFFSGLPNLLPQKIRLPLISFFSGVSYIWEAPQGTGSDWKNFPGTAHTDRQTPPLLLLYIGSLWFNVPFDYCVLSVFHGHHGFGVCLDDHIFVLLIIIVVLCSF